VSVSVLRSEDFVSPRTPIDLTNCDREPIHIPGAIQPHGILLGVDEADGLIKQASRNAAAWLGTDVLGQSLDATLGNGAATAVRDALDRGHARTGTSLTTNVGVFEATVHRSGGLVIVELEPTTGEPTLTPSSFRDTIREALTHIESATTLADLAGQIASQMRRLTGFDRVWVYRFHEDWHGEIIGESKREDIEPWLGMHYPASDIPTQARALFLKNWLRMIPDIGFKPVPLDPVENPLTGQPLDLGNSVLRSVSPIHIEYLSNMGVTASLVISLIHRGQLWGLISGHHYSGAKVVPVGTRTLCELLAQALSLQVGMAEQVEDRERALEVRSIERQLRERLPRADGYQHALTTGEPNLMDLTRSTGAALCDVDDCVCVGHTPNSDELRDLARWLRSQSRDVFETTMLSKHYPPAGAWCSYASGLLAVALSPKRPHYILWFRPERKQTIRWAGDPNKPASMTVGDAPRLSPRGSFALWEEERRATAEPWTAVEIQAAMDLRGTLLDLLLVKAEEIAMMNAELETANQNLSETAIELEVQAEELLRQRDERETLLDRERLARSEAERANRAKADFLAMMSHELRTPLNAIGGYAQMIEMGVRGPVTESQLTDLQRIQSNQRHLLGLINNILNFAKLEAGQVAFSLSSVDLHGVVAEIESLVLPQLREKQLAFSVSRDETPLVVKGDAEKIRQILVNLVSNAIKFTNVAGSISIAAHRSKDHAIIDVADTGRGIPRNRLQSIFDPFVQVDRFANGHGDHGIGLGLAISRDLAHNMGGELTVASEEKKGSTFTLSIPLVG
jgi:light-regulated signal transduction histidine kinase (bacteriophytochrome)